MRWTNWVLTACVILLSTGVGLAGQRTNEPADTIEAPFTLYNEHLIVVKGRLGTLEDVKIMLDTGKSPTAVSTKVAERLRLAGHRESMLLSNGTMDVESVVLPRFEFGTLHVEGLRTVVQDLSYLERKLGVRVEAIAGLDVLRRRSFAIDYKRKKIVFASPKAGSKTVPFETLSPFATIKAIVAGQEMRLLVDCGTRGLLLYRSRLKVRLEEISGGEPAIVTAAGSMRTRFVRASSVILRKENLGPQTAVLADVDVSPKYEFDGLLGFKGLGFQRVWLDFEHGLLGWE